MAVLWNVLPVQIARAEVIRSFDSIIRLNRDASLDVTETILMDFGKERKHGTYRFIPLRQERNGDNYRIDIRLLNVTDDKGKPLKYIIARHADDFTVRIGDPRRRITGRHTYRIRYLVYRAVQVSGGVLRVRWNVTGNDWPFAVQAASASFYPPSGTPLERITVTSYAGPTGSQRTGITSRQRGFIQFSASQLKPGEGLTFETRLPRGTVQPPGSRRKNRTSGRLT
jgi:hypothetical protein